ncbi:hypothetical protein [Paenibacillus sp. HW567]|uniref:hypothetical protein n=1 Tax=Paenibacillus sp. HW567 TaxID=1034769 RepID=UPI0012EB68FE|nr:hypothetical protein [Paenibacillus sp. HW567]
MLYLTVERAAKVSEGAGASAGRDSRPADDRRDHARRSADLTVTVPQGRAVRRAERQAYSLPALISAIAAYSISAAVPAAVSV